MGPLGDSESEKQTRKQRVDPRLQASGWRVVPLETLRPLSARDREAVEEYPTGADHRLLRPYQIDANTAIEQAIAECKRQVLVARRILFLVDRRVLAAQAVRGFASFDAVKERPVRATSLAEKLTEAVLGKAFRGRACSHRG